MQWIEKLSPLYASDVTRSSTDQRTLSSAIMTVNSRTPDASGNVVISTGDAGNVGGMELYAIIQPAQWTAITGGYRYTISNSDIQLGMNVVEVWLDDESVQTSTMEITVPQDGQCRIDIVTKPTSNLGVHISLVRDGAQVIEDITENLAGAVAKVLEGDTNSTGATVASGTYVYLRGHSTLSEGLYKASSDIANGASLSGSNLTSMVGGGINLLSSDLDAIGARIERKNSSVLTYAANTNQLWSFYSTVSGQADNPTSSGSYLFLVFSFTTGRTIFGIGLGTYEVHINKSTNGGTTWSGWRLLSTTTDYITTLAEIFGSTSTLPSETVARCRRNGRTINLYLGIGNNALSSSETSVVIGTLIEGLRPGYNVICPLYSRSSPYLPIGTAWIDQSGKITVYKEASTTGGYISMTYNAQ